LLVLLSGLLSLPLQAQTPAIRNADRLNLLQGVSALPWTGSPGRALAIHDGAVQILSDSAGWAGIVAARFGRGRVLVITHDSFYAKAAEGDPGNARFFQNALGWLGRGRILVIGSRPFATLAKKLALPFETAPRPPADLSGYSLIHLDYGWKQSEQLTDAEIIALQHFVQKGGSLMTCVLPWVWKNYSDPGKAGIPVRDSVPNRLLAPMGIGLADWSLGSARPLTHNPEAEHVRVLLAAGLQALEREGSLPVDWLNAFMERTRSVFDMVPHAGAILTENEINRIRTVFSTLGPRTVPSEKRPITPADSRAVIAITLMDALARNPPPGFVVETLPHAEIHPGAPAPGSTPVTRTFKIEPDGKGRWQSTGLWARAGKPVRVRILSGNPREVSLVIGIHQDNLFKFNPSITQWKRWPDLVLRASLATGSASITSPHGGLVSIDVPDGSQDELEVRIEGAIPAARFTKGVSPTSWRRNLARTQAPWGEIEGQNIIISAPLAALKNLTDPEGIIAWWDRVVLLYPALSGKPLHPYKQRFVPDVQISMGYMHSGYPVMTWMDVAGWVLGVPGDKPRNHVLTNGAWGHFHELGHNYQMGEYTWEGAGEVTVNIFTLHTMEKMGIVPAVSNPRILKARRDLATKYNGRLPFERWSSEPFIALLFYVDLVKGFGWTTMGKVLAEYAGLAKDDRPQTNAEKRDQWLIRFSKACGRNIAPHMHRWNIPFSAGAEAQLRSLPVWNGP
ncbi:MAG TPA: M60 family metallopeptidase, partial [Spirochaetota bacterium]|nr:M60 family metallopeptidase [Spirochaetota bacterium]